MDIFSFHHIHRKSALFTLLYAILVFLSGYCLPAQQASPFDNYEPPSIEQVLSAKAPVRILISSRMPYMAWQGEGIVKVVEVSSGKVLTNCALRMQVGAIFSTDNKYIVLRKNNENFCSSNSTLKLISDKPIMFWNGSTDKWSRQDSPMLVIPCANNTFSLAREILLEDYLRFVVPSEMPGFFHPQALRAQAVIARTYTLSKLGKHSCEGADLCAQVHCQMYNANCKSTIETDAAVRDTNGQVLICGAQLANTYYHSCCGGVTDDATFIWGTEYSAPYLTGVIDGVNNRAPFTFSATTDIGESYCSHASNTIWKRTFTSQEIDTLVKKNIARVTGKTNLKISSVSDMTVTARTPHGRVWSLAISGDGFDTVVYGDNIRWLFGNGLPGASGLWSTLFEMTSVRDPAGKIIEYRMVGAGRGHGLGLCQWGADGRGKAGQSYREILQAYYAGTQIIGK